MTIIRWNWWFQRTHGRARLDRGIATTMHLTLKQEATKPAAGNVLQQHARFDAFVERYN